MKYKLKRDLPFARAGAEIWIDNLWDAWIDAKIYAPTLMTNEYKWEKIMLGKISVLEAEGWIEEVKPREWYISETVLRDYARKEKEDLYYSGVRKDIIKISEVTE